MKQQNKKQQASASSSAFNNESGIHPKDARAILLAEGIGSLHGLIDSAKEVPPNVSSKPAVPPPLQQSLDSDEKKVADMFFYYDRGYYMEHCDRYIPLDRASVANQIAGMKVEDTGRLLNYIQTENYVRVVDGIAGKSAGIHIIGGKKHLILSGPNIIFPKKGDFLLLLNLFEAILGDDVLGKQQVEYFQLWLKTSYEAIAKGVRTPGQSLVLAGPAGCGKSLLIELIVTILGGRRAHPNKYLSGRTTFNGDLLGAEVLVSDDDSASRDPRARREVGAGHKNLLFSGQVSIEAKYAMPASFAPMWRLVVAVNDEPASMGVLPRVTPDIEDKISLLKCHKRPLPEGPVDPSDRERYLDSLKAQIPGLLDYLTMQEIPEDMQCARCGVKAVQHPDLLAVLKETPAESMLLDLIDEALPLSERSLGFTLPWEGTANELRVELHKFCQIKADLQANFPDAQKVGSTLGKLVSQGKRVERLCLRDGTQRWRILPPVTIKERLTKIMAERREAKGDAGEASDLPGNL